VLDFASAMSPARVRRDLLKVALVLALALASLAFPLPALQVVAGVGCGLLALATLVATAIAARAYRDRLAYAGYALCAYACSSAALLAALALLLAS
jgi:hypothetical protein